MILSDNYVFLSDYFKTKLSYTTDKTISFTKSKDNLDVPIVNGKLLHSAYFPQKDTAGLSFKNGSGVLNIAIGFGAGYHLASFAENNFVLAVSESPDVTLRILENVDLCRLFKPGNLKIITVDELKFYFDFIKYDTYNLIIKNSIYDIFRDEIDKILLSIKKEFNPILLDVKTQKQFGYKWFKNLVKNLINMKENNIDKSDLTIDKNKIILVTGAGSSLDSNLPEIKKYRDKLFIAATDTSAKALLRSGIIPDTIFTFDAGFYSTLHYTEIKQIKNIRILCDITSYIPEELNKKTPLLSHHPLVDKYTKTHNIPVLNNGLLNIGSAVIDFFCRYFGEHPVVAAGIDFGIENRYYSSHTYIEDYSLQNSSYFKTAESIDSSLKFRFSFTDVVGGWHSNSLLKSYMNCIAAISKFYTLSSSPFSGGMKISTIKEISSHANRKSLHFPYDQLSVESLIKDLRNNDYLEKSLCLSLKKTSNIYVRELIDKIIEISASCKNTFFL